MLKTSKQKRLKSVALAAALACSPMLAGAAGLGRITVLSSLGQPLRAELEITANKDELSSLAAKLASAEAFRVAGIEYASALSTLHFSKDIRERNGKRYIEVTTDRPVNDPFIDMLVELSWSSGQLVREYTFLLDPPGMAQKMPPVPVAAPEAKAANPAAFVTQEAPRVVPVPAPSAKPEPVPASAAEPVLKSSTVLRKPSTPVVTDAGEAMGTRQIKPGDTLGKIAAETKPDGVSLDQMLVALFRKNADAFDGNMNRMRAGKILSMPDVNVAREIDPKEARREVLAQSSDFNAYRRKLADAVAGGAAVAESGGRTSSGKITPRVEDKVPAPVNNKDKLEVSRTESSPAAKGGAKGTALQGRLSALEEDVVSRERALREASSRIAQLEKNLVDLKKLAEMKSEAGAAMQKQAEAAKPAVPTAAAPAPSTTPPVKTGDAPAKTEAVLATPTPPAAAGAVPAPAGDTPKPPPPKKKVIPPPPPEPEPTFIEENGPLVFGGAGILAALLGYLGFSAYRRKKQAAVDTAPISRADLSTNSVFSEAAESINVTAASPSEFSISETTSDTGTLSVDPLVEADTYLAFGRDAQAEEILLEALKVEPTRHAIHVKLLEIYSARRSAMQFNTLAQELRDQTGAQGPEWEKVVAMGVALDPNNPLYRPPEASAVSGEATVRPVDLDATMVFSAPPVLEPPPVQTVSEPASAAQPVEPVQSVQPAQPEVASLDFDLDLGEPAAAAPVQAGMTAGGKDDAGGLDFDLELGDGTSASAPSTVEPSVSPDSALALDIDFNLDTPSPESQVTAAAPAGESIAENGVSPLDIDFDATVSLEAAPAIQPQADNSALALDLELPVAGNVNVEAVSPDAGASIDFDFNLGDPEPAAEPSAPAALDLGSVSLDLEAPTSGPTAATADIGLDLELPALEPSDATAEGTAEDNPEAATKLELALAYEEMGDKEGARELLEEVVAEGSPNQRAAAQAKLAALI